MKFKKILIFRIGHLGDTVVALPALWAVRNAFPDAEITLLSNSDVKNPNYISASSVLPKSGLIDKWETYPTNISTLTAPLYQIQLLMKLRQRSYDALFYLMPRSRTAEQIRRDRKFFRLAGIRKVIGADYLAKHALGARVPSPTPRIERESDFLLNLLRAEGVPADSTMDTDLRLTPDEVNAGEVWLKGQNCKSNRLVAVAPGSKWDSKIWPEERFGEVVYQLISELGIFPIVLGGREDRKKGDRLLDIWGRGANAAGSLSVRESAALLRSCDLYLGNDTGTMHLAAAVGTPCVAVFAAIDWVGKWEPFGSNHTIFRRTVECEGCHSPVCHNNKKCLDLIETKEVLAACEKVLRYHSAARTSV